MQEERKRIYNESGKLNDDDRQQIGAFLLKAGYSARIGSVRRTGKTARIYFVEFWKEYEDAQDKGAVRLQKDCGEEVLA